MYKNIHSSFIHDTPQLETAQMLIYDEWIQTLQYLHAMKYHALVKTNSNCMHNLINIMHNSK